MRILCAGGGFTGRYLGDYFSRENEIYYLSRDGDHLKAEGRKIFCMNFLQKEELMQFDAVIHTIPPVIGQAGEMLLPFEKETDFLLNKNPCLSYIFISTTSVYFDSPEEHLDGNIPVINELTDPNPSTREGETRLKYEEFIQSKRPNLKIIRSGGIYGPGRSIVKQFLLGNFSRTNAGNKIVSRIHVHDLCRLCLAMSSAGQGISRMVNGVDEHPSPNAETFAFLEDLLKISIPGNWRHSPPCGREVRSLYAKDILNGFYLYPDYRIGFSEIAKIEN